MHSKSPFNTLDSNSPDLSEANSVIVGSRKRIDEIDAQLVGLLNQRAALAVQIGVSKMAVGQESLCPARESEIMRRILEMSEGPMPRKEMGQIFSEIISVCRNLQKPPTIAFLGPETTFSHMVALNRFGHSCELRPLHSIMDVFQEVENGRASFGVVPVENSIEGGVSATMDCFVNSGLRISGEIYASIRHMLMSSEPSPDCIKRVYSHPQALNQCRKWLNQNMRGVDLHECSSTAEAARRVSEETGAGAIASSMAARKLGLNILAQNIQDRNDNKTRFLIIGPAACKSTGDDKTSLYFISRHQSGSLCRALNNFSNRGINLSRIESRPLRDRPWEYSFFVDCEGHMEDSNLAECLKDLRNNVEFIKILGSYPRMDPDSGI